MRNAILPILILITTISFSQELNLGIEATGGPRMYNAKIVSLGPIIEFRPADAIFSLNSGIIYMFYKNDVAITIPLSLRFILGKRLRYCPSIGGFVRSYNSYGFSAGMLLDYEIRKNLFLYIKGEFDRDHYSEGENMAIKKESSYWFGIGIKVNVL